MLFEKVTPNHILLAVKDYKEEGIPNGFSHSSTYDVIIDGKPYPPKVIMAYANYHATGRKVERYFKGGIDTYCFKAFERNRFTIRKKNEEMKEPRFFKLQISDAETKINHVDEVLNDNRITSHVDYAGPMFQDILPKDVFMIHKGNQPHSLVEVIEKINDKTTISGISFGIDYKIKKLGFFEDLPDNLDFKINNRKVGPQGTFTHLFNESKTKNFVRNWYNYINPSFEMNNIISILQHKKQIILQGPPGTGKTRLAKQIAEELTKENKTQKPNDKIQAFFENKTSVELPLTLTEAQNRLNEFHLAFPKEKLNDISLENYAIGTGENSTFCWWMEIGLKPLGYYFPGNAGTYRIYWSKKNNSYEISGDLLKGKTEEEAFNILKQHLHKLVNNKDYSSGSKIFTESFMLKILHSYYPDEYFPINSNGYMDNLLKLLKIENHNLSRIDKNKKIQNYFLEQKNKYSSEKTSYEFMLFLFQEFDFKETLEEEAQNILGKGDFKIIQFHPSYTYEDFIRGITVKNNEQGKIEYKTEDKVLASIAEEAYKNYKNSLHNSQTVNIDLWVEENFELFKKDIQAKLPENETILSGDITIYEVAQNSFKYGKNWKTSSHIKFEEFKKLIKAVLVKEIDLSNNQIDKEKFVHAHYRYTYYNALLELFFNEYQFNDNTSSKAVLKNYVLIIDEINRANLSTVLGELIYALEYRGESVESMYDIEGNRKITLSPNLFIIGTMNTADRSVGQIDYAIRRRFAFVDVLPKILTEYELNVNREENAPKLLFNNEAFSKVKSLFLNDNGSNAEYLSDEFKAKDVQLGHSYFIYTEGNFHLNLNYEIKPILLEYINDGILKASASEIIDTL